MFLNLSANATTVIKGSPGKLNRIIINNLGATSNVCTVYDNNAGSGTTIAVIDTVTANSNLNYDLTFAVGLTIVMATGTAADITVVWDEKTP